MNDWSDEEDSVSLPFPKEKCPKCDGYGWGFKNNIWENHYEFYCPECGYDVVGDFGETPEEKFYTFPTILNYILPGFQFVDYPVLPYLQQSKAPIISSWDEPDEYPDPNQLTLAQCPNCSSTLVIHRKETDEVDEAWLCFNCKRFSVGGRWPNSYDFEEGSHMLRDPSGITIGDEFHEKGSPNLKQSDTWGEKDLSNQTFLPIDQEWIDSNRSEWEYFCPNCGDSQSVMLGPSSENDWTVPEWEEDEDLVNRIRKMHEDNPNQNIDYCGNCKKVWIQPEYDYTVHKKSAADPEWWSEFVNNTPYMLHMNPYAVEMGHHIGSSYEDAKFLLNNGGGWRRIPKAPPSLVDQYTNNQQKPWTQGEWGKGAILNGEALTWSVTKDGIPHHSDVAGDMYEAPIWISPDGNFTDAGWINTQGLAQSVEDALDEMDYGLYSQLGLTYIDPWDWVMQYWGNKGTGYGHAQNVLDILNKKAYYEIF